MIGLLFVAALGGLFIACVLIAVLQTVSPMKMQDVMNRKKSKETKTPW